MLSRSQTPGRREECGGCKIAPKKEGGRDHLRRDMKKHRVNGIGEKIRCWRCRVNRNSNGRTNVQKNHDMLPILTSLSDNL